MIEDNYPIKNKSAIANKQQAPKNVKDNIYEHTSEGPVNNSQPMQQMALVTESKRQRTTINYADQSLANRRSVNYVIRVIRKIREFRKIIRDIDSTDKSYKKPTRAYKKAGKKRTSYTN